MLVFGLARLNLSAFTKRNKKDFGFSFRSSFQDDRFLYDYRPSNFYPTSPSYPSPMEREAKQQFIFQLQ
jgi:hypothetical protein